LSEEAPGPESTEPLILAAVGSGFEHRFLFVTVASRRVLQIRAGARPRVDAGSHKPTVVAVAEVLAGFVPYIAS
jgi:hypothetical protein